LAPEKKNPILALAQAEDYLPVITVNVQENSYVLHILWS
jgi:hypothetical protein